MEKKKTDTAVTKETIKYFNHILYSFRIPDLWINKILQDMT